MLEKRSGHLEKLIREKEIEKNDLIQSLKIKDIEYKQLQSMLERLKDEHEERHARLKGKVDIAFAYFQILHF